MSFNKHSVKLEVKLNDIEITVNEDGYTYNSVNDQLRNDLDNATDNVLKIFTKIWGGK